MPVERCAVADLETKVAELEAKGRILEIVCPDPGSAVIRYELKRAKPGERETR